MVGIPNSQMRKVRLREVKRLAQRHPAKEVGTIYPSSKYISGVKDLLCISHNISVTSWFKEKRFGVKHFNSVTDYSVTLGELLKLSKPQFPQLYHGMMLVPST